MQAGIVFAALGVTESEERCSSNYPPDRHYFVGRAANASFIVCDADDECSATYPCWVQVDEAKPWATTQQAVSTEHIAQKLAGAGLEVRKP